MASTLFDRASPLAVTGLRQAFGALALLLWARPRLAGRSAAQWRGIAALAVAAPALAQRYHVRIYSEGDGLPSSTYRVQPLVAHAT